MEMARAMATKCKTFETVNAVTINADGEWRVILAMINTFRSAEKKEEDKENRRKRLKQKRDARRLQRLMKRKNKKNQKRKERETMLPLPMESDMAQEA